MEPLLSVVTITYNHEPYIAKCIEGVLMQKVNFPIEFIIAEDCSTDGTRAICEEYARKYPDLIKLILSDINKGALPNERMAIGGARGKYIALCEGDDYWTDERKLQKQVDFLESNAEYTVCFHDRMIEESGKVFYKNDFERCVDKDALGFDLTFDTFYHYWITYPFSMVFKRSAFSIEWYDEYDYFRDSHVIFHLLMQGKGYIFNFVGGVRTIHDDSMFYSMDTCKAAEIDMLIFKELYQKNKKSKEGSNLKKEYSDRIHHYLNVLIGSGASGLRCVRLMMLLFFVKPSPKELAKNMFSLLTR